MGVRREFGDDGAPGLTADQGAAEEGGGVADSVGGGVVAGAEVFAGGERGEVGTVGFAREVDGVFVSLECVEEGEDGRDCGAEGVGVVALVCEVAAWFEDYAGRW